MAHATPQVTGDLLIRPDRRDDVIRVGTATWFAWLEQASTFAFVGVGGRYTARKERTGRSGRYWKAYRMERGKLRRAYLGKSSELTLERLQAAADSLSRQAPRAEAHDLPDPPLTDSASPADQLTVSALSTRMQLLATKLSIPSARPGLVPRPHLVERLLHGTRSKLTLLVAPAGYGKTTLLAQGLGVGGWELVRGSSNPQLPTPNSRSVAWVSLDAGDNDPLRFWSHLIAALDRALGLDGASIGATALAALQAPQPPPISAVLTDLFNALSHPEGTRATNTILILDDYHTIEAPAIHQALTFVVERLPAQLHLVLATRSEPPLPLGRLRVRGELAELRIDDLRFSAEETLAFLTQVHGPSVSPADVAALEGRAEGWVAALQLAALALRGSSDLSSSIAAFKGGHRLVMDYVTSEVLDRLPPHLLRFVMHTAILERMCGSLCDAVLERQKAKDKRQKDDADDADVLPSTFYLLPSQQMLEQLERANLFVVPLDDQRTWYRYHPLFVEVARERLRGDVSEGEWAALHHRASVWYEEQGLVIDAIQHAISARDSERAAALIERDGLSVLSSGSAPLVRGWLDALPDPLVRTRPRLCLYHGLALMAATQLEAAEARLQDAECGIATAASHEQALNILAQVSLARASIARYKGDLEYCVALSQRVMLLSPQLSATVQAEATLNLARGYQLNGDAGPAAAQLAERAIALMRRAGNTSGALSGIVNLARLYALQGQLRIALATYAEATQIVAQAGIPQRLFDCPAYHTGLADLLCERNELAAATHELEHALTLVQDGRLVDADVVAHSYLVLARIEQARGDGTGALAALDAFAELARRQRFEALLRERGAALRARLSLAQGNLLAAQRWADTADIHPQDAVDFAREDVYLIFARVRIAQWHGQSTSSASTQGLDLLDRLLVTAEGGGRVGSAIAILIVRALALQAQNNLSGALVTLARALVLAAPEGYIRSFVDEGVPMLELLREAYARNIVPDYVERLLHAFPSDELQQPLSPLTRHSSLVTLVEALTVREREVLQLIAEGASNAEIARRLTLSLGTVKRYTNNIFGKLHVQSRTQAIVQAQKLRLL